MKKRLISFLLLCGVSISVLSGCYAPSSTEKTTQEEKDTRPLSEQALDFVGTYKCDIANADLVLNSDYTFSIVSKREHSSYMYSYNVNQDGFLQFDGYWLYDGTILELHPLLHTLILEFHISSKDELFTNSLSDFDGYYKR